jgi:hypothetical protein
MDKVKSYTCSLCKFSFPFENIMYTQDGKRLICRDCYKLSHPKDGNKTTSNQNKPNQAASDGIKVICKTCRYKFVLKVVEGKKPMCPYCGKSNLMRDEGTAQTIIDEVSKDPNNFR